MKNQKNKAIIKKDNASLKGWAEYRLFRGDILYGLLEGRNIKIKQVYNRQSNSWVNPGLAEIHDQAIAQGLTSREYANILDLSAGKMFKENLLWKAIKRLFDIDLKIPFITGYYTTSVIKRNLVVTRGKRIAMDQLGGTTTTPVTAIALGIGAVAPAAGYTALGSEITTGGGSRGAATVTNTTTTTAGDTEQWVKSFTFTSGFAVTEEGLLDNNTSGGNLLARQTFSAVNVVNTDVLQITHKVQAT